MIYFTTEFELDLPTEKDEDEYNDKVFALIDEFLGEDAYKYRNTYEIKYLQVKNRFSFKWNDSIIKDFSNLEGEDRVRAISKMINKWFRGKKYLKNHHVRNFASEYNIKRVWKDMPIEYL